MGAYGIGFTREVTRPQRGQWHNTSLAVKLNGFLLGQPECVKGTNGTRNRTKINRESKYGVIVIDGTVIRIVCVCKFPIAFEGPSNDDILSRFECEVGQIFSSPVPVSPVGLIIFITE